MNNCGADACFGRRTRRPDRIWLVTFWKRRYPHTGAHGYARCVIVAAFVVSIFAFIVTLASAWFSRQQARAARTSSDVDVARRHDERTPTFDADVSEPMMADAGQSAFA